MRKIMSEKCLFCYLPLPEDAKDYHAKCSKKFFGDATAPALPYSEESLDELALQVIESQMTVTGVQPKLSLHLTNEGNKTPKKFTIVGLWGEYILKPQTIHYQQLPEVEDLTMHLAEIAGIKTVPHSLIRMQSGRLAYITKRVDRTKKGKLHMEDMCQLTDRLTEHKYRGSYEQIAKAIFKYSKRPGLDTVDYCELVLFSFLTGNADMHLKNFSLLYEPGVGPLLAPAYDLVATALVNPADDEDLALTLNGKKKKLKKKDFEIMFSKFKLNDKQQENIFTKMEKAIPKWFDFIEQSFISKEFKERYKEMIDERWGRVLK
jgi:serine/threonine-protein kinase HipA